MKEFETLIQKTIECINENNFFDAENYLKEAIIQDVSAPQTHNLFGILAEHKGDELLAAKHYRAACALDPTFKPAINNLERIVSFQQSARKKQFDFDIAIEEEKDEYFIEYDEHNVGHIKKIKKEK